MCKIVSVVSRMLIFASQCRTWAFRCVHNHVTWRRSCRGTLQSTQLCFPSRYGYNIPYWHLVGLVRWEWGGPTTYDCAGQIGESSGSGIVRTFFFAETPLGSVYGGLQPPLWLTLFYFFSKISFQYFNTSLHFQRFLNFIAFCFQAKYFLMFCWTSILV